MKSPLIKSIGEVVTDYGARVMKVFKKGLLGRSLFDFYGDIKADTLRTNESSTVPGTPADGKGGVIYTKSADGKLYYKSNEVSEIELSANGGHTDEDIQDIVGAMFTSNTETRISATYEDGDGTIDLVVDDMTADTNTQLSNEQVQDIVGGMVTGNTESGITVTYQDGDGTIDFEVGTLNQDTTGNAATATALTSGDKTIDGDVTIGADQAGHDFTLHGATTQYSQVEWDASQDHMKFSDQAKIVFGSGAAVTDFDSSIQADGSNLVIYNDTGNIQIGDTVEITGDLTVSGDVAIGDDAEITSIGSMVFRIDSNNNEGSQTFTFRHNASTDIAQLDEGGNLILYGNQLGQPSIKLQQNTQSVTYGPPVLYFERVDVSSDNSDIGRIDFRADDSAGNLTTYAQIIGRTEESGNGTEGGQLEFKLASHDAEAVTGLKLEDGDAEDEIDVTIASGTDSLTTVAGNLTVNGSIIGKQRQVYFQNFIDDLGTNKHYLPFMNTAEQTTIYQEEAAVIMPCKGRVVSVAIHVSSISASGDLTIGVHTVRPGISHFTTGNWVEEETETLAVASTDDYHTWNFVFSNAQHFEAGDLLSISILPSVDYTNNTFWYAHTVIEYDWNNDLGSTSAEYDDNP